MWAFLGLLVLAGLVFKFWPWILGAWLLWLVVKGGLQATQEARAEAQAERERTAHRNAELMARADLQHAWVLDGDGPGAHASDRSVGSWCTQGGRTVEGFWRKECAP